MTNYPRSAYGSSNPNAGKPANGNWSAWGGYAYPNCPPSSKLATTDYTSKYGERLRVSFRTDLVPLATLMFQLADLFDYRVCAKNPNGNGENWGPWGMDCRAISGSNNPSGHSAGLSMDWNAPNNPYSYTFQSDMPPDMVSAIESCGWYWGGRYTSKYDAMHYGYCWTPADVAGHMDKARTLLGTGGGDTGGDESTGWPGRMDGMTTSLITRDGNLNVFTVGEDHRVYQQWPDPAKPEGWSGWSAGIPGQWSGGLSARIYGEGISLFGVAPDGTVQQTWSDSNGWHGPVPFPGVKCLT